MSLVYKSLSEIKDFSEGVIEGYANVYNLKDSDGDVSLFGSFAKTVSERARKIMIYKNHDDNLLVGVPTHFDLADTYGLRMTVKMNMDTQLGRDAYHESKFLVENGFDSGLSVGGWIVKRGKNKGEIAEWKLREVSLLTKEPANGLSLVDTIKSVKGLSEVSQEEFWKVIVKAYDDYNFSDNIKRSLESFLLLSAKSEQDVATTSKGQSAESLILDIYKQFI